MMTDYISREAAIEAVYCRIHQIGWEHDSLALSIRQAVRDVPTADVREVKRGRWIVEQTDDLLLEPLGIKEAFRCSSCGYSHVNFNQKNHNYCPNCGADMREEQT